MEKDRMKVSIFSYSSSPVEGVHTLEEQVAYAARVSNPSNQMNMETAPKLIDYLIRNHHWSPLEMAHVTLEIETTRDIARQILRHRSFSFQEFCLAGDSKISFVAPNFLKEGKIWRTKTMTLEELWKKWNIGAKPRPTRWGGTQIVPMQDRIARMHIKCLDEQTGKFTTAHIKAIRQTGIKPIYRVLLADGKQIKTTKEHKFFTQKGFVPLEDIVGLETHNNRILMTKKALIAVNDIFEYQDAKW